MKIHKLKLPNKGVFYYLQFISHFSESIIAIDLVPLNLRRIIFTTTIIGTERSIQVIHHKAHQNDKQTIIKRGLKFNLLLKKRGSTKFQIMNCTDINHTHIAIINTGFVNCTIDNNTGKATAIIDPIFGIKFNININNAQNEA